jgi:ribokinase
VQRLDAPTGCAGIVVDARGENQIVVAPGANLALCSHHVDDATLATAHTVLLQMETDPAQNAALLARARAAGCQTILNNAPARRLAPEVLALLGLLVVNETELAATLEGAGIQAEDARTQVEQVEMLAARFEMAVVLTLGVDAVDTTGAGDTFTGVLAAARMEGQDWPLALRTAAAAAALACTKAGAQVAQPTRAEVNALLASSA